MQINMLIFYADHAREPLIEPEPDNRLLAIAERVVKVILDLILGVPRPKLQGSNLRESSSKRMKPNPGLEVEARVKLSPKGFRICKELDRMEEIKNRKNMGLPQSLVDPLPTKP